ncbi:DUF2156 domain-containing protein [Candidatus Omnitrophota bacterium]
MIPRFPTFKPITLEDKPIIDDYFRGNPPVISELNFTNLFIWQEIHDFQISQFEDSLLISATFDNTPAFLQPLVSSNYPKTIATCFDYLKAKTPTPSFRRAGEDFIEHAQLDKKAFTFVEDRDNFDYIYSAKDLIELPSQKFHDKKNLIRQFTKQHTYSYLRCCTDDHKKGFAFIDEWCTMKQCDIYEGLAKENRAVKKLLRNIDSLDAVGGAIELDGKVIALAFGEFLNNDTFVVHIEKARADMVGLYQTIHWEFLRNEATRATFINREQDVGVAGLRKAKLSYNPVRLLKKYTIVPK